MLLQKYRSRCTQPGGNRHTKCRSACKMKQTLMRRRIRRRTRQRTYGMQRIRQNTFPLCNVLLPRLGCKFDCCPNHAIIAFTLSISRSITNRRSTAGDTMLTQKYRQPVRHKSRPSIRMNACMQAYQTTQKAG